MIRKLLLGALATLIAAGSLFFAAAPASAETSTVEVPPTVNFVPAPESAEAASAAAGVPGCVDVYLGNNIVWKYAKVTNNCSYDVDGVQTVIAGIFGNKYAGPCFYLDPGETRIDRYDPAQTFHHLKSC